MNHIVADLGYGDAGKGSLVDFLCGRSPVVATVRFNGGPQAGHRVVMADGREHVFSQFGSGTLRGVPTFHSRFMAIDPVTMVAEGDHLIELGIEDPYAMVTVDPKCLIVTPYHRAAQREREDPNGHCGSGHGVAVEDAVLHPEEAVRVEDILFGTSTGRLVDQYCRYQVGGPTPSRAQDFYEMWLGRVNIAGPESLATLAVEGDLVFEGAQGVLLDERYGFHPHTTWSTCTFENAEVLLKEAGATAVKLGVLRAFSTRHGPGPFVSEGGPWVRPMCEYNTTNDWQGGFRLGYFDAVASRYACEVAKPDALVVTHLDNAVRMWEYTCTYLHDGQPLGLAVPGDFDLDALAARTNAISRCVPVCATRFHPWSETIEELLGVPVVIESWGPRAEDKRRGPRPWECSE